jgi:hypothetical protein
MQHSSGVFVVIVRTRISEQLSALIAVHEGHTAATDLRTVKERKLATEGATVLTTSESRRVDRIRIILAIDPPGPVET